MHHRCQSGACTATVAAWPAALRRLGLALAIAVLAATLAWAPPALGDPVGAGQPDLAAPTAATPPPADPTPEAAPTAGPLDESHLRLSDVSEAFLENPLTWTTGWLPLCWGPFDWTYIELYGLTAEDCRRPWEPLTISGLKDQARQDQINAELRAVGGHTVWGNFSNILSVEGALDTQFPPSDPSQDSGYDGRPVSRRTAYNIRLDTGERLHLSDLFLAGVDIETVLRVGGRLNEYSGDAGSYQAIMNEAFDAFHADPDPPFYFNVDDLYIVIGPAVFTITLDYFWNYLAIYRRYAGATGLYTVEPTGCLALYYGWPQSRCADLEPTPTPTAAPTGAPDGLPDESAWRLDSISETFLENPLTWSTTWLRSCWDPNRWMFIWNVGLTPEDCDGPWEPLAISGLKDQALQDQINAELKAVGGHTVWGNFSNILSVEGALDTKFIHPEPPHEDIYTAYPVFRRTAYNIRLDTGEPIHLSDVFLAGTDIERLIYQGQITEYSGGILDVETRYRQAIHVYRSDPNPPFYFSKDDLYIVLGPAVIKIFLDGYWDSVAIYRRYAAATGLYTTEPTGCLVQEVGWFDSRCANPEPTDTATTTPTPAPAAQPTTPTSPQPTAIPAETTPTAELTAAPTAGPSESRPAPSSTLTDAGAAFSVRLVGLAIACSFLGLAFSFWGLAWPPTRRPTPARPRHQRG
ncbi:MAG: hypothetical protein LBH76_09020 [Propionibacteriaceae bacterium]|jgi:hypothetical protein|nr:hypothetical protein [Propionibacteriaceae bacterium]